MSGTLVVGEALVDVVVAPDGGRREHPGGSPMNVAIGLARLGRPTWLLSRVGDDRRGASVAAHLAASGVRVVEGTVQPGATSTAEATLAPDGSATYVFDLEWSLPGDEALDAALPGGLDAVHTGSIGSWLEPGAAAVERLVARFRTSATTTFDPNLRPDLVGDPSRVRRRIDALVERCDVVKLSDEDAAWLQPDGDADALLADWLGRGPALVVLTRGGAGMLGVCRAGRVEVPAPRVAVADTVGAGDSAMAAVIDGLGDRGLLGAPAREALRAVGTEELRGVLEHAARVAAVTVSRPGADPPWRAELARRAQRAGGEGA